MAKRMNKQIVLDFQRLQKSIPEILEIYNIDKTWVCDQIKMGRATFYRKLKNQTFTIEEMISICNAVNK